MNGNNIGFNNDDNELLISLIKERTPIYDPSHKQYSNKTLVDNLWMEISKEMNRPVSELRFKWKKLRNSYTRDKRQDQLHLLHYGKKRKGKWYLSDALGFLEGSIKHRKLVGYKERNSTGKSKSLEDIPVEKNERLLKSLESSSLTVKKYVKNIVNCPTRLRERPKRKVTTEERVEHINQVTIEHPIKIEKNIKDFLTLQKKISCKEAISGHQQKLTKPSSTIIKSEIELDSDMHFFKSLIPEVSKLTSSNKRKFKISVLNCLSELLDRQEEQYDMYSRSTEINRRDVSSSPSSLTSSNLDNGQEDFISPPTSVASSVSQF